MPRGDGTGPKGKGPMTGRGSGRRSGSSYASGNNNSSLLGGLSSFFRGGFSGMSRMSDSGQGGGRRSGGMGRGMGRGMRNFVEPENTGYSKNIPNENMFSQDASQLRERARKMENELNALKNKINNIDNGKSASQVLVDIDRCLGCGRCEEVCPKGAISVVSIAKIDHSLCTVCGKCVNECPAGALRIF